MKTYFILSVFLSFIILSCSRKYDRGKVVYRESQISWHKSELLDKTDGISHLVGLTPPKLIDVSDGAVYASWIVGDDTMLATYNPTTGIWDKKPIPGARQNRIMWWNYDLSSIGDHDLALLQADDNDVHLSQSTNNGKDWLPPVPLNSNAEQFMYFRNPSLAVAGQGHLYAIFSRKEKPAAQPNYLHYFARSDDTGTSWTLHPVPDIPYKSPIDYPQLLFSEGILYCLYARILYRSDDGGTRWKVIKSFQNEKGEGAANPIIRQGRNRELVLLWDDTNVTKGSSIMGGAIEGYVDIICSISEDGGKTWRDTNPINDAQLPFVREFGGLTDIGKKAMDVLLKAAESDTRAVIHDLAIARHADIWASAWTDYRNGLATVWISYSTDHGATWAKNANVPIISMGKALHVRLSFSKEGNLCLLWSSGIADPDTAFSFKEISIHSLVGEISD